MNQFKIEMCNFKEFSCMSSNSNLVPVSMPFNFDSLCAMLSTLYSGGGWILPPLPSIQHPFLFLCSLFCHGMLSICVTECFVYPFQDVNGILFLYVFLALQRLNLSWITFEDSFYTIQRTKILVSNCVNKRETFKRHTF